jgi:hypothetical protein
LNEEEEKIEKKIKTEAPGIHVTLLEKLNDPELKKIRDIEAKSESKIVF